MNFQPDLVVDDERATGWARVEIYGDKERGLALIATGRVVLGGLKSQTGTNQQQVQDREATGGGGFRHRWSTLADGSKIHAMTNDGHDTIRIYTARPDVEEKKPKDLEGDGRAPYLWVGLRRVSGGGICGDDDAFTGFLPTAHLYVWEPEHPNAPPGRESQILSRRHKDNASYTEVEYPLRDTDSIVVATTDISGIETTARVNFTNNGMYHMPTELVFDPKDANHGKHGNFYWDQCVLLDPARGSNGQSSSTVLLEGSAVHQDGINKVEKMSPSGERPDTREWLTQLPACHYLGAGYKIGCMFEHNSCDAPSPSNWLLEVRVGREPHQVVRQFEFTITHYSPRDCDIYPFGFWNADGSSDGYFTGANGHADGWWPTTITVDPKWAALSESDAQEHWPRGFQAGAVAAWRPIWCANNKWAQTFVIGQGDTRKPDCASQTSTYHLFIQAFGFEQNVGSLSGAEVFGNPCTGNPPPAQAITAITDEGATVTWAGIRSSEPQDSADPQYYVSQTPFGPTGVSVVGPGAVLVRSSGALPSTGTPPACVAKSSQDAFPELLLPPGQGSTAARFHWWWDESGFHTGPGYV